MGLVHFPLFLVACTEGARRLVRRARWQPTARAVITCTVAVGVVFVAIKVWHPAGDVYRLVIGAAFYPARLVGSLVRGEGVAPFSRMGLTRIRPT